MTQESTAQEPTAQKLSSSGTIKLNYICESTSNLYFTPAKSHTIDHLNKYAIFVPEPPPDSPCQPDSKAVQLKEGHVEIKIYCLENVYMLHALTLAAIKSVAVDISVEIKKANEEKCKAGDLILKGAVVPSRSHTK